MMMDVRKRRWSLPQPISVSQLSVDLCVAFENEYETCAELSKCFDALASPTKMTVDGLT